MMRDPVIATDGHTYEREAIENWLALNRTSPVTRATITSTTLTPNIALRDTIEEYLASNAPISASATASAPSSRTFKPVPVQLTARLHGATDGTHQLHLHVNPPAAGERQPVVLLAVIDNSGSMNETADLHDGSEARGFTRMDLVKHAIRTMIGLLSDTDYFGIVTFSTSARTVLAPTAMTASGKASVESALQLIHPDSQTNIWDGIRLAAQLANAPEFADCHIVGMLLTDGFPNVNPPRGIMPTLNSSIHMRTPWTFHTFGFGYNLDSDLLAQIASWGKGIFGFIPDCTMVGTVFINILANTLATAVPAGKYRLVYRLDDNPAVDYYVNVGPIILGQARDIVIPNLPTETVSVSVVGTDVFAPVPVTMYPIDEYPKTYTDYLNVVASALRLGKEGNTMAATEALATFEHGRPRTDARTAALLRDLRSDVESEGQIGMAPRYFQRWGEHYMRSYLTAQRNQLSMNFKDPGLQIYGGELFHELQAKGDEIFCSLPPPSPSAQRFAAATLSATATPVSMSVFHNASAGCFHGATRIRMFDNTYKQIREIVQTDIVWTPSGPATVVAVVICNTRATSQPMTQMGPLCITPWHPVRIEGEWMFPADIAGYTSRLITTVYNLVLNNGHIVNAEGMECVTLAHGFTEPKVAHPFFGTDAVLECLRNQTGWERGRPEFQNLVATRDPTTNMINGWIDVV
jgi:Mg-chelatase subunit ChlD